MNQYLSFSESYALLKKYDIPVVDSILVKNEKELAKACSKLKFPLAMKISSPDIIHKTDVNAVILNINSVANAKKEYKNLLKNIKKNYPKARIEGVVMQKMGSGLEIIAGLKKDEIFGVAIIFGLGGIFVEALGDVTLRIVPITKKDVYEMMDELKAKKILLGIRGKKYCINSLVNLLLNLSKLGDKEKNIIEMDLNPIFVNEKNAIVADIRILAGEKD
jgi:acyl-CoA synthetase (NDP forming)